MWSALWSCLVLACSFLAHVHKGPKCYPFLVYGVLYMGLQGVASFGIFWMCIHVIFLKLFFEHKVTGCPGFQITYSKSTSNGVINYHSFLFS